MPSTTRRPTGVPRSAFSSAAFKVSQTYAMPYQGHNPIGPTCAVADVTANGARIFTNHQNIYSVRTGLQTVLGMPMAQIRLTYVEGGSVFGPNPQGDVVYAAALMSQIAGKPVRMQFMRWDEHGWDNYGPAELMDIRNLTHEDDRPVTFAEFCEMLRNPQDYGELVNIVKPGAGNGTNGALVTDNVQLFR